MATQRPVHIDSTTGNVRELVAGDKLGGVTNGTATGEALTFDAIGVSVQAYSASTTLLGNTVTGTGSIVLATSPTLVTPVLGVASATSLTATSTTEQLRLGFDSSNYLSTTVSSAGAVTFDSVGASAGFTFSDAVTVAGTLFLTGTLPYVDVKPSGWASSGYIQFGVSPSFAASGNYGGLYVPAGKGIAFTQAGTTLFLMDSGGNVSFGTGSTTPLAKCESRSTTDAQFLASYDVSNYAKVQCASTGITTISCLGSAKGLVLTDGIVAGTGTARAKVGGTIRSDTTAVGNVGAGEDTLNTWTIPASTLAVNGESLEIEKAFSFAANANNKQLKIKFGATTIYASGAVAQNGGSAIFNIRIVRTSATTQDVYISLQLSASSLLPLPTPYQTTAETLSGTIVLLDTGEATANNDIVARCHVTKWVAAV